LDAPGGGTVEVPKVGKVKKTYLYVAVGGVGLYVAWRWYSASSGGSQADTGAATPAAEDTMAPSGVGDYLGGNVQYAGTTTDATSSTAIDTNAEWTADAVDRLSSAYDQTAIYSALGDYLARRPLTTAEQTIVRAAVAASGAPPVGGPYTVIEQIGDTTLAAPTGVKVDSTTSTTAHLTWSAVTGAQSYRIYRTDTGSAVAGAGSGTSGTVAGLTPNKTYHFQVAALSSLGKTGTKSAAVTGKTTGATLKAPTGLTVKSTERTSVHLTWNPVAGAGGYLLQRAGGPSWESTDASDVAAGLQPAHSYRVRVAALQPGTRTPGPWSSYKSIRTKK
jgi:hypothetical protein